MFGSGLSRVVDLFWASENGRTTAADCGPDAFGLLVTLDVGVPYAPEFDGMYWSICVGWLLGEESVSPSSGGICVVAHSCGRCNVDGEVAGVSTSADSVELPLDVTMLDNVTAGIWVGDSDLSLTVLAGNDGSATGVLCRDCGSSADVGVVCRAVTDGLIAGVTNVDNVSAG